MNVCLLIIFLRNLCEDIFCNAVFERPASVIDLLELHADHDENEADKCVEAAFSIGGDRLADAAGGDKGAPDVDSEVREDRRGTVEEETPEQMRRLKIRDVPVLTVMRSSVEFIKTKK